MTFDLRNPRLRRRLIIPAVGVILATVLYFLPTGYFVVSPGITRDVSGMISVGQGRGPGPGRFLMTTVATREANAWYFLYGALDPSSELRPESDFVPQGKSLEEYIKETEKMMRQSQDYARAAALRALGYPVEVKGDGVRVVEVVPDSPAQDNLQPGDVIVAIDAQKVERVDDLMKAMSEIPIGASVDVRFLRSGQEQRLSLKTVENKTRPGKAMIGVRTETLNEGFVFPKEIKIDADHITGPS
ncbi:MAG: PDZ domain-containing protein, partial [Firmicutes bacterium]|nr:PDZ domain-containing protein [Bacillota bacterium]